MTSNLVILWPEMPYYAATLTAGTAYPGNEITNISNGARGKTYRTGTASAFDNTITAAMASGGERSANYLWLGRASMFQGSTGDAVTLQGSNTNNQGTSTTVYNNAAFGSEVLYGPGGEDWITTFNATTAYRYWWLTLGTVSAQTYEISKAWWGTYFDFGRDPIYGRSLKRDAPIGNSRRAPYSGSFTWVDISTTVLESFLSKFGDYIDTTPIVLASLGYHYILNDMRLLHCIIKSISIKPMTSTQNDITLEIEEVI